MSITILTDNKFSVLTLQSMKSLGKNVQNNAGQKRFSKKCKSFVLQVNEKTECKSLQVND